MRIGIYPGSFDPVTQGHLDIILRASKLVDKLIIGVLINGAKQPMFSMEERVEMIQRVTKNLPNVEVEAFDGLLVDFAQKKKALFLLIITEKRRICNMYQPRIYTSHIRTPNWTHSFFVSKNRSKRVP